MPNDPRCSCGHDRNDHEDNGFGACRFCHCGQYEPDYNSQVDDEPQKEDTRSLVCD